MDDHALYRVTRAHRAFGRLAGPGFFARLTVLPVRSAFLFGPARILVCGGDSFRPAVLGHGPRMAVVRTGALPADRSASRTYQYWGLLTIAGRYAHPFLPHNCGDFIAGFCCLGLSGQL